MGTEYPGFAVTDSPLTLTDALDEDIQGISEQKRPFASKVFSSVPMDTQLPPRYPLCTEYPMVRLCLKSDFLGRLLGQADYFLGRLENIPNNRGNFLISWDKPA